MPSNWPLKAHRGLLASPTALSVISPGTMPSPFQISKQEQGVSPGLARDLRRLSRGSQWEVVLRIQRTIDGYVKLMHEEKPSGPH